METDMRHIFKSASFHNVSKFAVIIVKVSGCRCDKLLFIGEWCFRSWLPLFGSLFLSLWADGKLLRQQCSKSGKQRGKIAGLGTERVAWKDDPDGCEWKRTVGDAYKEYCQCTVSCMSTMVVRSSSTVARRGINLTDGSRGCLCSRKTTWRLTEGSTIDCATPPPFAPTSPLPPPRPPKNNFWNFQK